MAKITKNKPLWHPVLWPTWIVIGLVYLISRLPFDTKLAFGEKLGRWANKRLRSRNKVATKNIQACFPELSRDEQDALVEKAFISVGKGLMESIHSWWCDVTPQMQKLRIQGEDNLQEGVRRGKGVLLIGGHYTIFDLALPLIAVQPPRPGYVYRPNDNPAIDWMIERGRRRHYNIRPFSKREIPKMISYLKEGGAVWYACDQDFGPRTSVFVPFFGVPAGCINAPGKIARESGASVICVSHLRLPNGDYEVTFSPIVEDFGQNDEKDAQVWNRYLENKIRQYPDQYLWLHRRFKTRPAGAESIY
ncbi:MAG: lipid A biosynthesis acyltransferase [Gammaproteobacteria bacterium]|nr:MAG: lipid A biosynthesis acyltransferase [Pseudomonadota bacterium]PIE38193.1 MAG: lipid A biosynthesis acyltransferase [Gammaproteobacteria bacterium]